MARAYTIPPQPEKTRYHIFEKMQYLQDGGLLIEIAVCDMINNNYVIDEKEDLRVVTIDQEAWTQLVGTTGRYDEDDIWSIIDAIDAGTLSVSRQPYSKKRPEVFNTPMYQV